MIYNYQISSLEFSRAQCSCESHSLSTAGLIHMLTWIFRTHATLAQPYPRGPSTWLPPTRTNCGSFVAKAIWLKAKKASETCSGTALGAGEHMTSFVFVLDHTAAILLANSCMVMLSQHSLMCRLNGINNPVIIPQCINVHMVNW